MSNGPKKWVYFVDNQRYESEHATTTGRELRARANVDPSYQLIQEMPGNQADRFITDDTSVDLSQPGAEKFFSVPPATFGAP